MANDKDRILLNLGVQVDHQQVIDVTKEIQKIIYQEVDGKLELKPKLNKKSLQEAEGLVQKFKSLFESINSDKMSKEMKAVMRSITEDLKLMGENLKSGNLEGFNKELVRVYKNSKQVTLQQSKQAQAQAQTTKETKKATQANKEAEKAAKNVTKETEKQTKETKKAADQKKKAAQEEQKEAQETKTLTQQQEKQETEIVRQIQAEVDVRAKVNTELKETVSQLKEVSELQENIRRNAEGSVITVVQGVASEVDAGTNTNTAAEEVGNNLDQVFNGYTTRLQNLEKAIANAQQWKPQLQQLGMQGIEGDSRAAQENVYKAVEALKKMGRELQVDTGRALTETDEIFDYIFKNINTQGKTLISTFQEGHLQGLTLNLQNALKGSTTSITTQITHVHKGIIEAARKAGSSVEEALDAIEELFKVEGLKLYYDYGGKEGKDTEIQDVKALRSIPNFDPSKLKIWSQSDTINFNTFTKEINDSKPILKEYEEIWKTINDTVRLHDREVTGLNREDVLNNYDQAIEVLKGKLTELKDIAGNLVSGEDFDKLDKKYEQQQKNIKTRTKTTQDEKEVKEQKKNLQKALNDYRNYLVQREKAKQQYEHQATIGKVETKFEDTAEGKKFEAGIKERAAAIEELIHNTERATAAMKEMDQDEANSGKHESTGLQNKIKQLDEYKRNSEEIAKLEKRANIAEMNSKAQGYLMTGQQKSAYAQISVQLRDQIKLLEDKQKAIKAALPDLQKETDEIDEQLKNAKEMAKLEASVDGTTRNGFGERFRNAFQRIFDYTVTYKLINAAQEALRTGYQYLYDYDEALTNLRIVTGDTREETVELMKTYNKLGQELGATTIEVAEAANDWLRQGYSAEQSTELITASVRLSKLGMIETAEATQYLTSALRGYELEVNDVIGVVDKLTAVDLKAAVSAGDLAVAMSRTASSAKMAGVDQNTLLGYLATVQEVTQKSAETVGESFKSIFSRFGNVKAGKFVDDETGESLNDIEKVLGEVGIALRSDNDTFRETDEVLSEVAGKWEEYTDVERNAIATAVAGTRQRENFIVLMENWEKAIEYAGTAANSAGTSFKKMKAYSESLEGSIETLKATFQELVTTLVSSQELINVVQGLTRAIETLNGLDWEGLKNAASIIAGIVALFAGGAKIASMISALGTAIAGLGTAVAAGGMVAAGGIAAVVTAALPLLAVLGVAVVAIAAMNGAFETTEYKINKLGKEIEELNQKEKEEIDLFNQYEQLMAKSQTIYGLTAEEKENLKAISEELVNVYGLEASGVDSVTGAYIISNEALDENINKLKQQRKELLLNQKEERDKRIKDTSEELKNKHSHWDGHIKNLSETEAKLIREAYQKNVEYNRQLQTIGYDKTTYNNLSNTGEKKKEISKIYKDLGITDSTIISNVMNAAARTVFYDENTSWEKIDKQINEATAEYIEKYGQLISDVQDNIIGSLYGLDFSTETENFFRSLSADYIQAANEAGNDMDAVETKLKVFFTKYKDAFESHIKDKNNIAKKLTSDKVTISDYDKLLENNIEELAIIAELYGEQSKKYKETIQAQEDAFSENFGVRVVGIRDKLGTKEAKEELETFGNTVLQSANAYAKGTKSFEEYISALNTAVTNLNITETFKNNVTEMNNLLDLLKSNAESELNNIVSQFKSGSMGINDYLNNLSTLSSHFSVLSSEIEDSPLVDSNIKNGLKNINTEIEEVQKELKLLSKVIPLIGTSFKEFSKIGDKDIKTLTSSLESLGITGLKVGDNFYEGAVNIVKAMKETEEAWDEGQDAIEEKTRQTTGRVGALIGTVLDAIASQLNNTTFGFEYQIGANGLPELKMKMTSSSDVGLTELEKFAAREAGRGTYDSSTGTFSNDKNLNKTQLAKAIADYEKILNDNMEDTGSTVFGGYEAQFDPNTKEMKIVEKQIPLRTVKQSSANKIRLSNMLADSGISTSSLFGLTTGDPGSGGSEGGTTSEFEKHYAVVFQDLLQSMLEDKQNALEDFEKENDRLNEKLTHLLELNDNEGAKRVYDTMAQNKKQYEQELQSQLEWAKDVVNNQLLPAINKLVPDFAIASADDMTNVHKQKIQYYFDDKLRQIESDLHYLEQLDEDDLTDATKKKLKSYLSDSSLANDVKGNITALEDEKNEIENLQEATMTNIDTLLEFNDTIEETSDTLVTSQRDISNYKSAIDGVIENETERIETALEKFKMTPDEAIAAYEDLFNYLKYEFYPQSEAEAAYRAEKMDEILRERVDATKDNYSQIYSDAGTIKDYEVGLLQDEIDKINDKYDEQIEELENKRDIQEETNDLIEAETRLRNAQREKNKRVYREGLGFVWEADQSEIDDARKELEDLQLDKQINDLEKAQEEEVKAVQESIDAWEEWYKKLTNQMDLVEVNYARLRLGIEKEAGKITVAIMEQKEVFEELVQAIEDAREAQEEWEDYEDDYSGSSGITQQEKDHANSILNNYNKGSGSNSSSGGSKGKYTGSKTETGATLGNVYSGAGTRDESYVTSDGKQYVPGLGYVGTVSKNATGDKSFKGGLSMVGEQGAELTVLPRGTGILPNPITENLWEFGSNPAAYLDKLSLASIHTKGTTTNSTTSTTNEYMNIGTINLPNVTSAKQFVQELKSTVKRTKNTK